MNDYLKLDNINNNDAIRNWWSKLKLYFLSYLVKIAIISALGNWVGDAILFPLDTISTRLKASKKINLNPFHFAVTSFQKEKLNLFRGVQLTFHAAFIPSLIYLTVYDYGMNKVSYYVNKYTDHEYVKLAFPFFVSSIAQLVTLFPYLPVDTVRTRIQVKKI